MPLQELLDSSKTPHTSGVVSGRADKLEQDGMTTRLVNAARMNRRLKAVAEGATQ